MVGLLTLVLAACDSDTSVKKLHPNLVTSPEALDFGEVTEDYSSTLPLQLLNGGPVELNVADIALSGDGADAFAIGDWPATIESDETALLDVTFTPPQQTTYSAILTIESDDPESPHLVTLVGLGGDAPTPDIDLDTYNLDFGTVAAGSASILYFTVANDGDAPLTLGTVGQSGSGAFTLATVLDGQVIQPGQSVPAIVNYQPTHDLGDNGSLAIPSDDPDEPEVSVVMLGNGGGDFEYPIAVIDGPETCAPRELLTLDGSASSDPNGALPLTYEWTLLSAPDGSAAAESFLLQTEKAYLETDLAGVYAVQLRVTNAIGLSSAPATWSCDAIPLERLHVELIWSTGSADIDLHLQNGAGAFYTSPGDCNWCNESPDWGTTGDETDDPRLDIDDWYGYGPENINIDAPADDTYTARVHYYNDNGDGDTTATVRVYVEGVEAGSFSRVVGYNEVWDVAQIRWPDGAVIEIGDDLYAAPRRSCTTE